MFQQMQYFIDVVDAHSFTQAAADDNISQSAISQQIKERNKSVLIFALHQIRILHMMFWQHCLPHFLASNW